MAAIGTRFWCPLMYRSRVIFPDAHPISGSSHNMLDYNPDTIFVGSNKSVCNCKIDIDTQNKFNFGINWAGAFIRNGSHFTSGDRRFILHGSNDYNNWGSSLVYDYEFDYRKNFPLMIHQLSSSYSHRYWWVEVYLVPFMVEGAMFMLGVYRDVGVRWNWQSPIGSAQYFDMVQTFGGRYLTRVGNDQTITAWQRHYEMISDADMTAIREMFRHCRGGAYPMVMTDDIPASGWDPNSWSCNSKTSKLVRLIPIRDEYNRAVLGEVEVAKGLWNVTLTLIEEVWTGEGYLS